MYGKKTVIKYNNGKIIKGYTTDFSPAKNTFHLKLIEEYQDEDQVEQIEIAMDDIKAVFFVKDFQGNKDYQKVRTFNGYASGSPTQRKIVVIFKDGENFYGTTHSYSPDRNGFFVYPIDQQDNNDRIFVSRSALDKVHVKKFGTEDFDVYLYEN